MPPGSNFSFNVVQTAGGTTLGAEINLAFDPRVAQILDVQPGPAYEGAQVLVGKTQTSGAQGGTPLSLADGIAQANQSGVLENLSFFFIPGSGSAPAGDNVFITVIMQAGAAGQSPLQLSRPEMIDDQGNSLSVSSADGSVTVDPSAAAPTDVPTPGTPPPAFGSGGPPPEQAQSATQPAGITTRGTPAAQSTVLASSRIPLTTALLSVSPASQHVAVEGTFTFTLAGEINGSASLVSTVIQFKHDLVKVLSIAPGHGWKASASALTTAQNAGNSGGEMKLTLTADPASPSPTSGSSTVLTVTMQGLSGKQGKSAITLATVDVVDAGGNSAQLKSNNGEVVVGSSGGGFNMMLVLLLVAVMAVGAVAGGSVLVRRRMTRA